MTEIQQLKEQGLQDIENELSLSGIHKKNKEGDIVQST